MPQKGCNIIPVSLQLFRLSEQEHRLAIYESNLEAKIHFAWAKATALAASFIKAGPR